MLKRSPGGTAYFYVPFLWAGGVACRYFILLKWKYRMDPAATARLLLHEDCHIRQQKANFFPRWLWRYLFSDLFRFRMESEAYAWSACWWIERGYPRQASIMKQAEVLHSDLYRLNDTFSLKSCYDAISGWVSTLPDGCTKP